MTAVAQLTDLEVSYRHHAPAVRGVSLSIAPGEVLAVVGESGSGKTTTASALLGLLPAAGRITGGRIEVDGLDVTHAGERVRRGLRGRVIGLVPQDPMVGLDPTRRVASQLAEAVRLRGVPRRTAQVEVLQLLHEAGVDDPELRARQYPHELSGGLRQRVLIALALAGRPRLVVADEPTSALDVTVQRRILDHLVGQVRTSGTALLIITHDLAMAADRADRIVVMQDGRVVEQGPTATVVGQPREAYTRRLIAAAPGLRGFEPRPDEPAPDVLRLTGATVDFPGSGRVLDGVDLTVQRGRTLAVVGESGSGKTTALRVALGLQRLTAGRIALDGQDLTDAGWKQWRPLRRRVQLVHQNPFAALDPRFTVAESVAEPLVSFRVGDRGTRATRAAELIDRVGLPADTLSRLPAELSGGQRQRVAIARALALSPEILLLDEPVSALDVSVQAQILDLLADLQRELGVSYLFVSHDLAVVAQVAHRVAVLHRGRLVETGSTTQVFTDPRHERTRELLDAVPGRSAVAR
jgi:ABC-type glutathione transport system ATPase component